ncbi:MAG: preprotein translocase subunit SecY [Xanthomonadales bacterium PRO6]|nr:Protein translocase subunit SecY [Xanthomonadales bacterium]MCE7930441.1 preprotein translocase subunit SecY [Xanthomonadales bacterium PRO6]
MANASNSAGNALGGLGRLTELRTRLLFVLGALIVFRAGSFIPVPGVNPEAMLELMQSQRGTIIDVFNMFSGGALERFSILALGVMPYISASIVVQILSTALPSLQALKKEGEAGRRTLTKYTRWGTLGLSIFQGFGVAYALQAQAGVVPEPGVGFLVTAVISLTAGTMYLMWLGEQVTERGIGNGISILIFAGIVAGFPGAIASTLELASTGQLQFLAIILVLAIVVVVTAFVVFMERAQRRITVNYARRMSGRQAYQNQSSHLPLKLNMSGVIPPIFASSLILFPATAATWFAQGEGTMWLQRLAAMLGPEQPLHMLIYSGLIAFFAFFYTALVFNAQETADNLKKSGALIPGIRPGKATAEYIDGVLTRLTAVGALYLVAVCLLPEIMRIYFSVPFYFGGTSLLIVVVVVMDFMAQIQAHLMSHQYDSLLKKANLKNVGRGGLLK